MRKSYHKKETNFGFEMNKRKQTLSLKLTKWKHFGFQYKKKEINFGYTNKKKSIFKLLIEKKIF